ncbi:uncharacterized protein BXZ73DRAFT_97649 [Epithele typhae]|uniref:uncharacterized protein n=1 Tax=Epithele typhae TaxID=378194 RepID=UPI0020084A0C|nr:uncharacterized protein BXZ73DRAFT_97649 [Epithele typhae]KAH9942230.1 hypothetical protein BXZ73DRAFT_97649 [Epithele typhae]
MAGKPKALHPLVPLASLSFSTHQIPAHNLIPNTSLAARPLIVYRAPFATTPSAEQIEAHLRAVGVCFPMWRWPMYPEDHFHTTAHEFVVVHRGRGRLNFGGRGCAGAVEVEVVPGDAVLIPGGVSHALLEDLGEKEGLGSFEMVGSYMEGSEHWDMCYGKHGEEEHVANIPNLTWFDKDPLYGEGGPAAKC